ncbi:integrase catalytic domain-containing protein [Trichonephila clavipes]|nr:integrase catalytic domain-containing protein [Trichonephila clavipes]
MLCKRFSSTSGVQVYAALRVEQSAQFSVVGIDFSDPLNTKDENKHYYIVLFTCAVTRALHLELVNNLTTVTFLLALRRFISCRELCSKILTGNAKTFKRFELEPKNLWKVISDPTEKAFYASYKIYRQFIIERAPWRDPRFTNGIGVLKRVDNPLKTMDMLEDRLYGTRKMLRWCLNVFEKNVVKHLHKLLKIHTSRRRRLKESIRRPPKSIPTTENGADCSTQRAGNEASKLKLKWDDPLPENIQKTFRKWRDETQYLEKIDIPRYVEINGNSELHLFVNACKSSYGACVYVRTVTPLGVKIKLIRTRSSVAPLKTLIIPRLELMACCIGARLIHAVFAALDLPDLKIVAWSDSMVALWGLKNHSDWSVFVANRVNEIRSLVPSQFWRHVPVELNSADLLSRSSSRLFSDSLWWEGPSWLLEPHSNWPIDHQACET